MYDSISEIVANSLSTKKPISELIIEQECTLSGLTRDAVFEKMKCNLEVMLASVERGIQGQGVFSKTGLTGGEAVKVKKYRKLNKSLSGDDMMIAVEAAMATNEVNAAMGVVCATPTAGSSGPLPGVLYLLMKKLNLNQEQMLRF
ncbi:L-serine ammonia-lyase, iron-sulfur-dependent, subunit beta, partial [Lactobacillus iners]|uniref:L-serine ammonia-lyase, iron-sulfur-dependent, subunit beta n=1 Tax=Lactobacillus iners TaxID=147802 RepID=UPI001F091334